MNILFINPRLTHCHSEASIWARRLIDDLRSVQATVTTLTDYPDHVGSARSKNKRLVDRIRVAMLLLFPHAVTSRLIEFRLFCLALSNMASSTWKAWRIRKGLCPDVIYARTFEYDWTPWLVALILKRPLVLEVHGSFNLERRFRGLGESQLVRRLDRGLWQRAALIRVVSKPVAKVLADESVDPERVRFIPYGFDVETTLDRPPRSPKDPFRVVFVGSFYPWHGVEILVDAFAALRGDGANMRLSLIGDGISRPACERRVRELGMNGMIEFTGWLPHADVVERLKLADLAVAPFLRTEPFYFDPAKLLEYMAFGLPVVASDIERIAEILSFGQAGALVKPGDVSALASAMIALANDEPRRLRLGNAARDIVERDFSRQMVTQNVIELCREAAAGVRA